MTGKWQLVFISAIETRNSQWQNNCPKTTTRSCQALSDCFKLLQSQTDCQENVTIVGHADSAHSPHRIDSFQQLTIVHKRLKIFPRYGLKIAYVAFSHNHPFIYPMKIECLKQLTVVNDILTVSNNSQLSMTYCHKQLAKLSTTDWLSHARTHNQQRHTECFKQL